jgi:hypothetical protein
VNTDRQNTSPEKQDGSESQSSPSKKIQGKKGSSGSSKKMTQKEQSERFINTAQELEVDETLKLEKVFEGLKITDVENQ